MCPRSSRQQASVVEIHETTAIQTKQHCQQLPQGAAYSQASENRKMLHHTTAG